MQERTSTERVVVTGAAGFIGAHFCRVLLAQGAAVLGLDNFDPFYARELKEANLAPLREHNEFTFAECDICDGDAMIAHLRTFQPSVVVHLAALAGVRPSIDQPQRYAHVNVDGTVNVLEACRASGCPNVLFASSSSVYGNNEKTPFSEDDPVDFPISPYAATKRAGELICHTYAHLFDLRVAALRFFTVYGPRQRPDLAIATFMRLMSEGKPIRMFGDGTSSRDYTFIDDIVAGMLAAQRVVQASPAKFFRIWNLGGAHPITLRELIDAIAEAIGENANVARVGMQPGDVERTFADVSRGQRELGYVARTTLRAGLRAQWQAMESSRPVPQI